MHTSFQRTVSDRVLDIPVTEDEPFPVKSGSGIAISSVEGEGNLVDLSGSTVLAGSLSFTANSQFAIIDTQGFEGAAFTISGFGTATLAVQWSNLPTSGFVAGLVGTVGTTTTATSITANGQYTASSGGRYMKIIVTAFTSGTIVVTPVLQAGASAGGSDATAANQTTEIAHLAAIEIATEALQAASATFGAITAGRNVLYDTTGTAIDFSAASPVTQSGTWNITNISGTVSLPTGAATAAKQPALGTAGTASADVLSVQGIASGTPLIIGGNVANDAADSGNPIKIGGVYSSSGALTSFTVGDRGDAQIDVNGNLRVALTARLGSGADGASNSSIASAVSSSNGGNTGLLTTAPSMFNGTTWDRTRSIAGTFGAATGVMAVEMAGASFSHITTNTTTVVKATAGILHKVIINTKGATANVLTLYNDTTGGTANAIAVIDTTTGVDNIDYDLGFSNGLQAVTATGTAADITIVYR